MAIKYGCEICGEEGQFDISYGDTRSRFFGDRISKTCSPCSNEWSRKTQDTPEIAALFIAYGVLVLRAQGTPQPVELAEEIATEGARLKAEVGKAWDAWADSKQASVAR
jgi:hypothetical protein